MSDTALAKTFVRGLGRLSLLDYRLLHALIAVTPQTLDTLDTWVKVSFDTLYRLTNKSVYPDDYEKQIPSRMMALATVPIRIKKDEPVEKQPTLFHVFMAQQEQVSFQWSKDVFDYIMAYRKQPYRITLWELGQISRPFAAKLYGIYALERGKLGAPITMHHAVSQWELWLYGYHPPRNFGFISHPFPRAMQAINALPFVTCEWEKLRNPKIHKQKIQSLKVTITPAVSDYLPQKTGLRDRQPPKRHGLKHEFDPLLRFFDITLNDLTPPTQALPPQFARYPFVEIKDGNAHVRRLNGFHPEQFDWQDWTMVGMDGWYCVDITLDDQPYRLFGVGTLAKDPYFDMFPDETALDRMLSAKDFKLYTAPLRKD